MAGRVNGLESEITAAHQGSVFEQSDRLPANLPGRNAKETGMQLHLIQEEQIVFMCLAAHGIGLFDKGIAQNMVEMKVSVQYRSQNQPVVLNECLQGVFFPVRITTGIDDQRIEIVVPKQIAVHLYRVEAKRLNMHNGRK